MICARCKPSPDFTRAELAEHATETGHPLCVVCAQSLPAHEPQACGRCVAQAVTNLADIADAWPDLHTQLEQHTGSRHVQPGGDILAMIGPGSEGRSQIRGALLSDGLRHDEHAQDEHSGDPQSVAHELARWEDDWRRHRGDPAATTPPSVGGAQSLPARELHAAVTYLTGYARWAAVTHPAFDEFADDVWRLRQRVHDTLGLVDRPETGAPCLDCSTPGRRVDLERGWEDPTVCRHERPDLRLRLRLADWRWETVADRNARVAAWETVHAGCVQGGRGDTWDCPRCGRRYDQAQYLRMVHGGGAANGGTISA